jgi:hypothetical protein
MAQRRGGPRGPREDEAPAQTPDAAQLAAMAAAAFKRHADARAARRAEILRQTSEQGERAREAMRRSRQWPWTGSSRSLGRG